MRKMLGSLLKAGAVCGMLMVMNPFTSLAAIGPGFTAGTYVATITAESVNINKSQDSEEVLMTAKTGNTYEVLEDMGNGWMKVRVNDSEGFLPVSGNATVEQVGESEMAEVQQDAIESSDTYKRQQVVNYAMQFVGGRYKYGGSDPRTGTDCSGFTMAVMSHFGVSLPHHSGPQANCGRSISSSEMRPGDLVSYAGGGAINHVALYIGNGQVVHAASRKSGIKISTWNYRSPVAIRNVLGD